MEILDSTARLKEWSRARREQGETIGLVPTMGYLHDGHVSLMRRAREENQNLVVTIFVNPTQFGPTEDLDKYPRDADGDVEKCREVRTDVVFMPEVKEIYANGFQTYVNVEEVSKPLCGASRPGHFRGVATVVLKLINMAHASSAYFGKKDYQQLQVIETMARDLNVDVSIRPCDTIREQDGLAMSSRNAYLSPDERKQAVCLYQSLQEAQALFTKGETDPTKYLAVMHDRVRREPDAVVDYVELVHPKTLNNLVTVGRDALAILAVRIGKTRLIDNMVLHHTGT